MHLLDTCAAIWLMEGRGLDEKPRRIVEASSRAGRLRVSPITLWEIALLLRKNRIALNRPLEEWWDQFLTLARAEVVAIDASIALEAARLPGNFHNDPADRIIVATARVLDAAVVTADRGILDYAALGHLAVLPCRGKS